MRNGLLVLSILVFGALGCDGFSDINGHVYDVNNRPIAGAVVRLEEVGSEKDFGCKTETDSSGRFSCGFTHAPFSIKLRLAVAQTGFKTYETEFTSDDAHKKLEAREEFVVVLGKE